MRADIKYALATTGMEHRYSNPKYPLVSINDLQVRLQYGTSALAKDTPPGLPVLRMNNIQGDDWDLTDLKYVEMTPRDAELYRLVPGDILFNRTNGSPDLVGKCNVFRGTGHWVFASYLIRVQLGILAIPEFVSSFLNTKAGRLQVGRVSRQILMSNINIEEIKSLRVPLPPVNQQIKLVEVLNSARGMRNGRLAEAHKLVEGIDEFVMDRLGINLPAMAPRPTFGVSIGSLKGSRLDPHFHSPILDRIGRTISSSEHATLGDIALFSSEQWNPMSAATETFHYVEIGGIDLDTGELAPSEIQVASAPSRARMRLKSGDILVSLTRPDRGAIAIVPDALEGAVASTGFAVIRSTINDLVSMDYLWVILKTRICLDQMLQRSSGGTYPAITETELRQIIIPVPPREIQSVIVAEAFSRQAIVKESREQAATGWESAKSDFENQLLG